LGENNTTTFFVKKSPLFLQALWLSFIQLRKEREERTKREWEKNWRKVLKTKTEEKKSVRNWLNDMRGDANESLRNIFFLWNTPRIILNLEITAASLMAISTFLFKSELLKGISTTQRSYLWNTVCRSEWLKVKETE